jgi:hypothetical protein
MKKSGRITAPRLWLVIMRSHRALTRLAEESITKAGLCLTDFAALEALLHKGPLTISEIQDKVLLARGSMTAAVDRLEKLGLIVRKSTQAIDARGSWNSRRKAGGWRHRASSSTPRTWRRLCQCCRKGRRKSSRDRLRNSGFVQRKN